MKSSSGSRASKQVSGQQDEIFIDPQKAKKLLKNLSRPPPALIPDYERSIIKSHEKPERRIRKKIPQLGEQENQSCPPLQVSSEMQRQAELALELERRASAAGVELSLYLSLVNDEPLPNAPIAYKYKAGQPLLCSPAEMDKLSTKQRWLHEWYLRA
jgi:hypothetical protein